MEPDELMDSYLDGVIDAMLEMRNCSADISDHAYTMTVRSNSAVVRLYTKLRELNETWDGTVYDSLEDWGW